MTKNKDVDEIVYQFVTKHFGVERSTLNPQTNFRDDLEADSLDMVEMTIRVEEEFGITLRDEEIMEIESLGDVLTLIKKG